MQEGVNFWSEEVVDKAMAQWGSPRHPWTLHAFKEASEGELIIDVGCGFGRFYKWLKENREEPFRYVGVDGSDWMIRKCNQQYGASEDHVFFVHDALEPFGFIEAPNSCTLLCNSVLIHLPLEEQPMVLKNIAAVWPSIVVMDIESKEGIDELARVNVEMGRPFYRTWNNPEKFAKTLKDIFTHYDISESSFPYGKTQTRHVFVALSQNRTKG